MALNLETDTTASFRARIIVEDGGTREFNIWDEEFTPFEDGKRPIREWVEEHFQSAYSEKDLRELLRIPTEGNFEILLEGTIRGFWSGYEVREYEEELDIKTIKHQKIPDSWFEGFDNGLNLDKENNNAQD